MSVFFASTVSFKQHNIFFVKYFSIWIALIVRREQEDITRIVK